MQVTAFKTPKILERQELYNILDSCLPPLQERDIVVITSKIMSICQGDIVKNDGSVDKKELVRQEADYYLGDEYRESDEYTLTIKNNILIVSSGIDESNANGNFILWPNHLQESTNNLWMYLRKKYNVAHVGVIITDSRSSPLRWGITGVGISWCGFEAIKDYVGLLDIFGRSLHITRASILDGLAAAAVLAMGEGDEQTPIALIRDVPFVSFQTRIPTEEELGFLHIGLDKDLYAPLLTGVRWQKGGTNK
jgi:dihydrofolate synthase / folylpolyglutamate synthase